MCQELGSSLMANSPSEIVLKTILSGAKKLKRLWLSDCDNFSDDVLRTSSEVNRFKHLLDLNLSKCANISMTTLETSLLTRMDNPLERIVLTNCDKVWKSDYQRYKQYLTTNCFKVDFQLS
jgi:hypothetical protein